MQDRNPELLSCGGNEKVGYLPAPLAALGKEPLHLEGSANVGCGRLDWLEGVESNDKVVPFGRVAGRVADLKVADPGVGELAPRRKWFDELAHLRLANALQHTRVDQEGSAPRFGPVCELRVG